MLEKEQHVLKMCLEWPGRKLKMPDEVVDTVFGHSGAFHVRISHDACA
jgi:hypothetical protein